MFNGIEKLFKNNRSFMLSTNPVFRRALLEVSVNPMQKA